MSPFALSGLLITLTCFPLAIFIFYKSPRSLSNNLMVIFNICVGVWGLGGMLAGLSRTSEQAIWAWRLANTGGFLLGVVFYHLSFVLTNTVQGKKVQSAYLFGACAIVLCLTGVAISETWWLFESVHYQKINSAYFVIFAIWVGIVIDGHRRLFLGYQSQSNVKRKQLQFVFYAMATGFIGGTSALAPIFGIQVYPYGNFSIPIYALLVTYAIVKHGFTDVQAAITRTTLLFGVYLIVLGIPFASGWWGRTVFESVLGKQWWVIPLGLSTILATAGPFAYAYLRRRAEERLLKEQKQYQRALQRAARGMTQVRSAKRLTRLIARVVGRYVKVTHASLFVLDSGQQHYVLTASYGPRRLALQSRYSLESSHPMLRWLIKERKILTSEKIAAGNDQIITDELNNLEAALVIPGLIEKRLIGFLVLGQKISGAEYSSDDLHAFTMLANEAAVALENAVSYEELLRVNEQLKAASERLVFQERLAMAGQFAAGMAHEIKNPLAAIKTFAQYLPERYADEAFREKFFRIVQSEIDRINSIVKELSDFAKPAPLQLQPVHLTELVDDALTLLSTQCLKQGVQIEKLYGSNGLPVFADSAQIKQVVLNVILNSLEAMPSGGRLAVTTKMNQKYLQLRIADSGCGISSESQQRIWDPFFTTKERGMGLGLSIVKGIVERHGGYITITSAAGKGTTVEIFLPVSLPATHLASS